MNYLIIFGSTLLLLAVILSNSSVSVSVNTTNGQQNNNEPNNEPNNDLEYQKASEVLEKQYSLYGLPEKDEYMSQKLREQLDNLDSKFYYDNCRYKSL